jgi:hypothetical protein
MSILQKEYVTWESRRDNSNKKFGNLLLSFALKTVNFSNFKECTHWCCQPNSDIEHDSERRRIYKIIPTSAHVFRKALFFLIFYMLELPDNLVHIKIHCYNKNCTTLALCYRVRNCLSMFFFKCLPFRNELLIQVAHLIYVHIWYRFEQQHLCPKIMEKTDEVGFDIYVKLGPCFNDTDYY